MLWCVPGTHWLVTYSPKAVISLFPPLKRFYFPYTKCNNHISISLFTFSPGAIFKTSGSFSRNLHTRFPAYIWRLVCFMVWTLLHHCVQNFVPAAPYPLFVFIVTSRTEGFIPIAAAHGITRKMEMQKLSPGFGEKRRIGFCGARCWRNHSM